MEPTVLHIRIERVDKRQKGVKRAGRGDRVFVTFPGHPEVQLPGLVGFTRADYVDDIASRVTLELVATTEEIWVDDGTETAGDS